MATNLSEFNEEDIINTNVEDDMSNRNLAGINILRAEFSIMVLDMSY